MIRTTGNQIVATPSIFVATLEDYLRVNFVLDLAASHGNQVCFRYFSDDHDLTAFSESSVEMAKDIHASYKSIFRNPLAWLNPPYGDIKRFLSILRKCDFPTICLLPARTDSSWFNEIELSRVLFLRGRIKFDGYASSPAFGNLLYFHRCLAPDRAASNWDWKKYLEIRKSVGGWDGIMSRANQISDFRLQELYRTSHE